MSDQQSKAAPADAVLNAPLPLARAFAQHSGGKGAAGFGVRRHRDQWYLWRGKAYEPCSDETVSNALWKYLDKLRVKSLDQAGTHLLVPKRSTITNVLDALKSVAEVQWSVSLPSWTNGVKSDPRDWIVFENGMLSVSRYIKEGEGKLQPHTTKFFNTAVLPFDFQPGQSCPLWISFLREVFDDDEQRIELLQEWMGYCLTDDTSHQKMMVMVGKPRSGKGTILKMMTQLVGPANCCSPSLSSIGNGFGLHALMHSRCALFGDAHLGRRSDVETVMENIKRIVGEDTVDIERKHQDDIRGVRLRTKLTMAANAMPDLPDASAAIVARLLMLPFDKSFVGREDIHLERKLSAEAGGVLCWALEGLARLTEAEQFTVPDRSKQMGDELRYEISPIRHFIHDRLVTADTAAEFEVDPATLRASVGTLWGQWCHWSNENGHHRGSKIGFGKKLNAAINGLKKAYEGSRANRVWVYEGVGLQSGVEALTVTPSETEPSLPY